MDRLPWAPLANHQLCQSPHLLYVTYAPLKYRDVNNTLHVVLVLCLGIYMGISMWFLYSRIYCSIVEYYLGC